MPVYEYVCAECGERFSRLRPIREMDAPARCPKCGGEQGNRVISQVAALREGGCAPSG